MVAKKKKKSRPRAKHTMPAERERLLVMPSSVVKFKQIAGVGEHLYALDEDGRVFVYIEHAWMQVDGDEDRCTVLPPSTSNGRVIAAETAKDAEGKSLSQRIL